MTEISFHGPRIVLNQQFGDAVAAHAQQQQGDGAPARTHVVDPNAKPRYVAPEGEVFLQAGQPLPPPNHPVWR